MASKAQALDIDENLVDEIVEEVLAEMSAKESKPQPTVKEVKPEIESLPKPTVAGSAQVKNLQEALEKYINSYKITAVELERELTEKFSELSSEQDKQVMRLQEQIDDLRTALIRLSNEIKKLREPISTQK